MKVIPGLREGARLWNLKADEVLEKIGLQTKTPGFHENAEVAVLRYMDDFSMAMKKEVKKEYLEALAGE